MLAGSQWDQKPPGGTLIDWSNPLATSLAACWPLNEGTSDILKDLTGNGSDATITGAAWTPTPVALGLNFAANDIAIVASSSPLDFVAPISVYALIYQTASNPDGAFILSKRPTSNASAFDFSFAIQGGTYNNQLLYQWNNGSTYYSYTSGTSFPLNVPTGAGLTLWPSGTVDFFIGGQQTASVAATLPPTTYPNPINIGNYSNGTSLFQLDGSLIVLMVWYRALSAADHAQLAANPWQMYAPQRIWAWGVPWAGASLVPVGGPTGTPVVTGIGYQFTGPILTSSLSITVVVAATGASVPGTVSYNSTTHLASFIPSASSPLVAGVTYLVTVSGATATDGTPMATTEFSFTPGGVTGVRWTPSLGRSRARLRA